MTHKNSLKNNLFYMLVGNGAFAFAQWLQLSLIAKYCSLETLGLFTLTLGVISPIYLFFGLQLRTLIVTNIRPEVSFNVYLKLRIYTSILAFLFTLLLALVISDFSILPFFILLSFQKILEGFSELFNSIQQHKERMDILARSMLLKAAAIIFSILLGLLVFNSLFIAFFFIILIYISIIYFNDYKVYRKDATTGISFGVSRKVLLSVGRTALPLGIVLLVVSLNANISKYFIEYFAGTGIQAIYSSITYILVIGLFVVDSLGQTFVPRISKYYFNKNYPSFIKIVCVFLLSSITIGLSLFLLSFFFGSEILQLLFNSKIASYNIFFTKYMLVSLLVFVASSLGFTLTAMGEFKIQPYINIFILLLNVVLSFFLIKYFLLDGIIIVLGICFFTQIIITGHFIIKAILKNLRTAQS